MNIKRIVNFKLEQRKKKGIAVTENVPIRHESDIRRQPHRVFYRLKEKAVKAGISIAELLRIGAFKLSIVERLTDFERDAIRELMYQGKNLNDQVKAC